MKIYIVTSVCRQIEGEIISIKFEEAFSSQEKASSYAEALQKTYLETIKTDFGPVKFACERSIHEMELKE